MIRIHIGTNDLSIMKTRPIDQPHAHGSYEHEFTFDEPVDTDRVEVILPLASGNKCPDIDQRYEPNLEFGGQVPERYSNETTLGELIRCYAQVHGLTLSDERSPRVRT
jgi:hypothetical protein